MSLDSNQPPTLLSRVVLWRQQVAVKLSPVLTSAEWTQIRNDLRALCISSASGGGVAQCNPAPPATGYLVWERPPTHVSRSKGMQGFEPYVKQFNRQYTNDGMSILSGVPSGGWYNTQNYLCGG
ncbi:MAG: hypothetical protein ACD_60C00153G0013 [uncultured bacterium]|nr:MAG: hypothetical protein ACD_60C00153G0013 [uncultured bacterium]